MTNPLPEFIAEASGRLGDRVYLKGKGRVRSRRYVPPRDPRTTKQQTKRSCFAQTVQAWAALTDTQRLAWNDYGATRARTAPAWAEPNTQTGRGAFMTLSLKRLHAQPDADLLTGPPAGPFAGDTITVTAHAGAGEIEWRASGPNAPGVATELLVQKMRRIGGQPCLEKYHAPAVIPFTEECLAATTPLLPGLWACAVRFICMDTGQTTACMFLLPVEVQA